jgi:hypothetical protein
MQANHIMAARSVHAMIAILVRPSMHPMHCVHVMVGGRSSYLNLFVVGT